MHLAVFWGSGKRVFDSSTERVDVSYFGKESKDLWACWGTITNLEEVWREIAGDVPYPKTAASRLWDVVRLGGASAVRRLNGLFAGFFVDGASRSCTLVTD